MCSEKKTNHVAGQPLVSTKGMKGMIHRYTQQYVRKPGLWMGFSRKVLGKMLLPNRMNAHEIHRRPTKF